MTKRGGENYEAFIGRSLGNPLALRVKPADLEDNLTIRRLPKITESGQVRLNKCLRAYGRLRAIAERPCAGRRQVGGRCRNSRKYPIGRNFCFIELLLASPSGLQLRKMLGSDGKPRQILGNVGQKNGPACPNRCLTSQIPTTVIETNH